jgi:hypothetical protein
MTTTEIIKKAIELPKIDQLELARILLFLDSAETQSKDVEVSWEREIADRVEAIDNGTAIGLNFEDVVKDIESKLSL